MANFHGIYSGSVLDNRDPENLARVLVRVPGLKDASNDVWARLGTMMAGRGKDGIPILEAMRPTSMPSTLQREPRGGASRASGLSHWIEYITHRGRRLIRNQSVHEPR